MLTKTSRSLAAGGCWTVLSGTVTARKTGARKLVRIRQYPSTPNGAKPVSSGMATNSIVGRIVFLHRATVAPAIVAHMAVQA
jgi:hypothetical protein